MLALLPSADPLEKWISTICGCIMIFLFLTSSSLNPLLYYCFTLRPPSITNYLFKLVAILDLVANIPSIVVAGLCLARERYTIFWPSTLGLVSCVTGCVAQATTTLLAVTRLILIVDPFYRVNKQLIKRYLTFYFFLKLSVSVTAWTLLREVEYGDHDPATDHLYIYIHDFLTISCFSLNFVNCVVGVVSSLATLWRLRYHGNEDRKVMRSSFSIFLMNVPYIFALLCNVIAIRVKFQYGFYYASFFMLHVIISAYNPCVLMYRTSHVKNTVKRVMSINYTVSE